MKKVILFDLDGTLWDACEAIAESWNIYVQRTYPGSDIVLTAESVRGICGKTMDEFGPILFPDMEKEARDSLSEGCCEYEVEYLRDHGGQLYPGVMEMMNTLRDQGYHLYIVSNCQDGYIEDFISWSGCQDLIEDIEDYGRTGKGKADNICLLMERNGLDCAVYVGDTQGDLDSANAAGIPFIFASYGFGSVDADVPGAENVYGIPEAVERVIGPAAEED